MSKELDAILNKDANAKRTTVNGLISTILTKYSEWDRFAEKFGFVSLTGELFRSLLEATDEEKLRRTAEELGSELAKEVMLFWFKELSLESFLAYLSNICRYGNLGEFELQVAGGSYMISGHHEYGERWSMFLERFLREAMRSGLSINPQVDHSKNQVILRFQTGYPKSANKQEAITSGSNLGR